MRNWVSIIIFFMFLLHVGRDLSAQSKKLSTIEKLKIMIDTVQDDDLKISYHLKRGTFMHLRYNADSTLYHNAQARALFSKVPDSTKYLIQLYGSYVNGYGYRGEYKMALKYIKYIEGLLTDRLEEPIDFKKEEQISSEQLFIMFYNIGDVYRKIGDDEKAYNYFIKGIRVAQKMNNKEGLSAGYNNLGMLYGEEGSYKKSKLYYNKAIELNLEVIELTNGRSPNDKYKLGTNYNNIGNIYKHLTLYDSAELVFGLAMDIMKELNLKYAQAVILDNLGELNLHQQKYAEALEYEQRALSIQRKLGSKDQQVVILLGIADALIGQKKWEEAEKRALEAFEIAETNEQHENIREATKVLVKIYDITSNTSKAYKYLRIYKEKNDLLSNEAKERAIENLKIGYETERSEAENQLLKQKGIADRSLIEQQQLYLYAFVLTIIFISVILIIIYRVYKSTSRQKAVIQKQATKLEALDAFKSRFFANVSHDLRTPLTLIQGHVFQIKNEDNYLNSKSEESLKKLETNTGKLIQLTDEIRDLILLEDDKLKLSYAKIEINSYLERMVNLFSSTAAIKKIDLNYRSSIGDQLYVHIDPLQFEKIIYNLLSNAFKFTPSGGSILVSLGQQNEQIIISIEDDGAGIAEEKVAHIFDRYYQASDNIHADKEGIGIGLALVLELVELHGGSIQAESELGKGTKVSVSIPFNLDQQLSENTSNTSYILDNKDLLLEGESGGDTATTVDVNENTKKEKNAQVVLIVDDHKDIRNYITELIADQYIIRQAANGKEALSILSKEKVDVVITDLMMPWLDGHGLIHEMKNQEALKHIPVLVVSARTTEEDKLKVLEHGVNDFLAKPFKPEELKLRINNALVNKGVGESIWDSVAKDKKKLNDIEKNILSKINQVILSKIDDTSLSVQDLADEMAASRRNAYRLINELTQMNPTDYIKHIRFQYVEDLIKKGKVKSLTEAAHAIGMSNPTHFGKNFESKMGVHPSALLIQ